MHKTKAQRNIRLAKYKKRLARNKSINKVELMYTFGKLLWEVSNEKQKT